MEVTNRFKELELTDRVPEELWMEVLDIVQEAVKKTIPKEKNCKMAKWLAEETLQIAEGAGGWGVGLGGEMESQRRKGNLYRFEC